MEAVIARIDSLRHDAYPNKSAAVVYLGGCNLRCPWCFVPDMLDDSKCTRRSLEEIVEDVAHFDGVEAVVFDGGEPAMQPGVLEALCRVFREVGLLTKVQTNGTQPGALGDLMSKQLLSRVSVDVKAPFDNQRLYQKMTGVRNSRIAGDVKKTLGMCRAFKTPVDVTVPVIPLFNDKPRIIRTIARQVAPHAEMLTLLEFDNRVTLDPRLVENPPPSRDELLLLAQECKPYVRNTRIRTRLYGEEAL